MCHIQVKLLHIYIVMIQYLTNILVNCNLDYSVKKTKSKKKILVNNKNRVELQLFDRINLNFSQELTTS